GDDVFGQTEIDQAQPHSQFAVPAAGQLPARKHGRRAFRSRRQIRFHDPSADGSALDADRGRGRALAGTLVPVRAGGDAAHPTPDVRYAGAVRLRRQPRLYALALPARAPAAGKSEPRPAPDVLGTPHVTA